MLKKPHINIILIISIVLGITLAAGAGIHLNNQIAAAEEKTNIVVPSRNIPKYHEITPGDLTTRAVPADQIEPGIVTTSQSLIGKVAVETLYRGEQIHPGRIADDNPLLGYDFVCVNIDLAKSGGAVPGNLVDIYKLVQNTSQGLMKRAPVARDAIVLDVWDGHGNSLIDESDGITGAASKAFSSSKPPAVVRLAVRPHETGAVVEGAVGTHNIVLVVKNKSGGELLNNELEGDEISAEDEGTSINKNN